MATYSFTDVQVSISGTGGSFGLGSGAGAAEEGITVAMREEKDTLSIGADGSPMHSLHADKSATVTVRLLKTSPVNQQLAQLYASQAQSSTLWGQNLITIQDMARGDTITCQACAFAKLPDLTYAKDGGNNEWAFLAGIVDTALGTGTPSL